MNNKSTANGVLATKKIENLVTWEIEFQKGSSEIEKLNALSAVEKHMIGLLIQGLSISVKDLGKDRFNITIGGPDFHTGETGTPTVVPPQPKQSFLSQISKSIKDIRALDI